MTPMRRLSLSFILLLGAATGPVVPLRAQPYEPALSVDTAIRRALESNPNIKVQFYYPGIAKANELTALGAFDPALTFDRSYAVDNTPPAGTGTPLSASQIKTDNYSLALGGLMPWGLTYSVGGTAVNERGTADNFTDQYVTFGGINLTQPLLRGFGLGANLVNVRVTKANRGIADWNYRLTLIQTVTNVVIGYSNLVLAHHELNIARHNRELAQTLLDRNVEEAKLGNQAKSQVTTARAYVAATEAAILAEENAVRMYDNDLRQLMGEKSFPHDQPLLAVADPVIPEVVIDPAKDFQEALDERPEYQAARLGITASRAQYLAARNLLLPQLDLVAGYGYNGVNENFAASRHMVETEKYPSSSIGISVAVPLTNAVGRGTARAARLTWEQSQANLSLTEANISLNVANSASQLETARKEVISGRTSYALATKALDDEMKMFRIGTSSTLLVIQQQQNLIGAENTLAIAIASEFQAVANYDEALGTTLERYHIDAAGK